MNTQQFNLIIKILLLIAEVVLNDHTKERKFYGITNEQDKDKYNRLHDYINEWGKLAFRDDK